jgi:hypothetical protein
MWENKTNSTETPSIKLLEERLLKVERILSQLAEVQMPIKLTTSCRGKLTTDFSGEDFKIHDLF